MATVRVHPIQLEYSVAKDDTQTCNLCGAEERWTSKQQPTVFGDALKRSLHLVHLVKAHLPDVQNTFTPAERKKEKDIDAGQTTATVGQAEG
ncbi:hypothetical protein [Saccharopolyspora spinosa]|uniref:Uncharacterized protein n=1 Tax=Saccharopolyspora spinosa TaxID=60894 RepID=A0A2N3Y5G8_SACSN|nr:hypothetical protein [Saccharopolyspora spinosa]PKW18167.1 hypothetical protein A8926_6233 [Saccharopolyspora spinosa]